MLVIGITPLSDPRLWDAIIHHPDIKRTLAGMRARIAAARAICISCAVAADLAHFSEDADEKAAFKRREDLLTPIAKAFVTEAGFEAANHGVQIFGGHGFIREWGMEQIVRDARIAMLYEGTTGIQALDLLGRKVLGSGGKLLTAFTDQVGDFIAAHDDDAVVEFMEPLGRYKDEWLTLSLAVGEKAMANADEAGAAAVDYLMYAGYVTLGYFWARMAVIAQAKLAAGDGDRDFYEAKLHTARFYFQRLLPRADAHRAALQSGADNLMAMPEALFAL